VWCFVHIVYLIGFKNRFLVLFRWSLRYISGHRGVRLIYRPLKEDADHFKRHHNNPPPA
jgi:NADH:ubiquinone reductase (H+-translocating)